MKLATLLLGVAIALVNANTQGKDDKFTYQQICVVDDKWTILHGFDCRHQIASTKWKNSVNLTGWSIFEVETNSDFLPEQQAYAAGYLEGMLSRKLISDHIINTVDSYCKKDQEFCKKVQGFINENSEWVKNTLKEADIDDKYWSGVNRSYHLLSGVIDGYEGREMQPRITFEMHGIVMINWYGDLYDLESKLNKTDLTIISANEERCSAIVKVAPNREDIFFSHVTMSGYQFMLRVLKLYKFGYDKKFYPGFAQAISSYPGMIYSGDDFYLMSSGLAVLETTITAQNFSVYEHTKAVGQLSNWVRVNIANQMARDGKEWCEIYSRHNSGTYNNQWNILDYNKFQPGGELPDTSLFYVLEQMPGTVVFEDMTWFLKKFSYWPSYNIPYFKEITDISAFIPRGDKYGDYYRWGKSPRAKQLERDHPKVVDMDTLIKLMRYNDFKNDPTSRCNCSTGYTGEAAIAARGDLNDPNGKYEFAAMGYSAHGAHDVKATNSHLIKTLGMRAWAGPTYDQQPQFQWSKFGLVSNVSHLGHPDLWNFDFVDVQWETSIHARRQNNLNSPL